MKRTTLLLCWMALFLVLASQAGVGEPEMWAPGPGGEGAEINREVVWLDTPDPAEYLESSEIIPEYDLETEIANDFLIEAATVICRITWWGGYWNGDPIDDPAGPFYATIYDHDSCRPGNTLYELIVEGSANQTPFDDHPNLFVYWIETEVELPPGQYWLSTQLEHSFPPQWGRLGADHVRECDSVFRSVYFSYPDWVPAGWNWPFDASQMLESECGPTAVESATWGRVKRLYR